MNKSHYLSFLLAAIGAFLLLELFVRMLPDEPSPRTARPLQAGLDSRDFREPILHPSQLASQQVKLIRVSQSTTDRAR